MRRYVDDGTNPDQDFVNGRGWVKKQRLPAKRAWIVRDVDGNNHTIEAHFAFNNGEEGLVFRSYKPGSEKTEVVAAFAFGNWAFYKEISN